MAVRLNKYLADRGVGARRKCDALVVEGRVAVNGRIVRELGLRIEESRDRVTVDGRPVHGRARLVYYVLNKPVGVITTLEDPQGRRTVRELLPRGARVYPVGRLDADTSGLLLLTNDGDLAHRLMHPRYGVDKVYRVRLAQEPRGDQLRRLATGVRFERDRRSAPARARRIDPGFDAIMIELTIHEGRHRQVRRMCEAVGLEVTGLHRVGYGPVRLGPLARGMFRELSDEEVARLRAAASRPGGSGARAPSPGRAAPPPGPPAASRVVEPADEGEEDWEETFVPGGGTLHPDDADEAPGGTADTPYGEQEPEDAPSWPARAGRSRGDDAWRAARGGAKERTGRPVAPGRRARAAGEPARRVERRSGGLARRPERGAGDPARRTARPARDPARATGRGAPRERARRAPARPSAHAPTGRGAWPERARGDRGRPAARGTGERTPRGPRGAAERARRPARGTGPRRGGPARARDGRRPARPGPMGERAPRARASGPGRPARPTRGRPSAAAPTRRSGRGAPGRRNPSRRRRG